MSENKNYTIEEIEHHILRFSFPNYIDEGEAEAFLVNLDQYLDQASEDNPLYLLSGADSNPQASRVARNGFAEKIKKPLISRLAVAQTNPFIKVLVKAGGRDNIIKFFRTEEECLQGSRNKNHE